MIFLRVHDKWRGVVVRKRVLFSFPFYDRKELIMFKYLWRLWQVGLELNLNGFWTCTLIKMFCSIAQVWSKIKKQDNINQQCSNFFFSLMAILTGFWVVNIKYLITSRILSLPLSFSISPLGAPVWLGCKYMLNLSLGQSSSMPFVPQQNNSCSSLFQAKHNV